jgi:hypothetical protein
MKIAIAVPDLKNLAGVQMNNITLQSERYNLEIFAREQERIKMGHPLYIVKYAWLLVAIAVYLVKFEAL